MFTELADFRVSPGIPSSSDFSNSHISCLSVVTTFFTLMNVIVKSNGEMGNALNFALVFINHKRNSVCLREMLTWGQAVGVQTLCSPGWLMHWDWSVEFQPLWRGCFLLCSRGPC